MLLTQPAATRSDVPTTSLPKITKKRRSNKKSKSTEFASCLFSSFPYHFSTNVRIYQNSSSPSSACDNLNTCVFQTMVLQDKSMIAVSKRTKQDKCQPYEQVLDIVVNDPMSNHPSLLSTSDFFIKSGFLFVKPQQPKHAKATCNTVSETTHNSNDDTNKSIQSITRKGRTSMLSIKELLN